MKLCNRLLFLAVAVVVLPLLLPAGSAMAAIQYLDDGALQNDRGGWDLPAQGTCPAGDANGYTGIDTRPECVALRLNIAQASCTSGNNLSWTTSGVCNDNVNTTQVACEAAEDRLWNPGTNKCSIVMFGDDRNNVVCALHGGVWETTGTCTGNWVMPNRSAYTPEVLTGPTTGSAGAGDQCLRCHNRVTQYNGSRVRDTEETLQMGHKNMLRKVDQIRPPGSSYPWGGPPFSCSNPLYTDELACIVGGGTWDPEVYPSDDSGNPFDWPNNRITVGGNVRDLTWIYGDWLAALPRAISKAPAAGSPNTCTDPRFSTQCVLGGASVSLTQTQCTAAGGTWYTSTQLACTSNGGTWVNNAGISYSCGRCHATGWTSDSTIQSTKEPEKSFPNITWDRLSPAPANVVNLSGGMYGDANQYSSWDVWGISCNRCHNAVIDTDFVVCTGITQTVCTDAPAGVWDSRGSTCGSITGAQCTAKGGTPNGGNSAPAGMSSHHNNLTLPTGAMCSKPQWTAQTQCEADGGTWMPTSGSSSCSVAGVCVDTLTGALDLTKTTSGACTPFPLQWAAASDIIRCEDIAEFGHINDISALASARFTGTQPQRGQTITALCMNCHRQETGGNPYNNTELTPNTAGTSNPGQYLKVGPAHGDVAFVSHPAGNQFLNSPHARFTGTFGQVATAKDGTGYDSHFMNDAEAANTGNGCTGCHDVHNSVVAGGRPFREECTECHSGTYDKSTNRHPIGGGTPFDVPEAFEACVKCHMPGGVHLWRINPDPNYSTFPMPAALSGIVNANTAPDGSFTQAVWNDMDASCGQCHGGGTAQAFTTGSVNAASAALTVASATGFVVGQKIRVVGAGALYYDEDGVSKRYFDHETYIKTIAGNLITLAGNATRAVTNAQVIQNATNSERSPYFSKTNLAAFAENIHSSYVNTAPAAAFLAGTPFVADYLVTVTDASTDDVAFPANAVTVNWGNGSASTGNAGSTFPKTYATAGTYNITLTVIDAGGLTSSQVATVSVPTKYSISGRITESDGSTAISASVYLKLNGITKATKTSSAVDGSYSFDSLNPGNYEVQVYKYGMVFDGNPVTAGEQNPMPVQVGPSKTQNFTRATFTVTVNTTPPLSGVTVYLKQNGSSKGTATTTGTGTVTFTNVNPGTGYTVQAVKSGKTFDGDGTPGAPNTNPVSVPGIAGTTPTVNFTYTP